MRHSVQYSTDQIEKEIMSTELINLLKLKNQIAENIADYYAKILVRYFKNLKPYENRIISITNINGITSKELVNYFYKAFEIYESNRKCKEIFVSIKFLEVDHIPAFYQIQITRRSELEFKRCKTITIEEKS